MTDEEYKAKLRAEIDAINFDDHPDNIAADARLDSRIRALPGVGEAVPMPLNLIKGKDGYARCSITNVGRVIDHRSNFDVWYDDFYQRIRCTINGVTREWTDADDLELMAYLESKVMLPVVSHRTVQLGVEYYAHSKRQNGPLDYFNSLKWDGERRISSFFRLCMGAEESAYVEAVSRNFWRGLVARVFEPGCKLDNMVVIEGDQGLRKSTALEVIAGEWFGASHYAIGSTDFLQSLAGKLIMEIPELDSMERSSIRTIKAVLSTRSDTYRSSYGRRAQDYKRQGIFVGTTNEHEYLDDASGGRRFWPVAVQFVDIDLIKANRDQFFAEAVADINAGETYWETPPGAAEVQEERRRRDAWEDVILEWLKHNPPKNEEYYLPSEIAVGALHIGADKFQKSTQMRLGNALRAVGMKRRVHKAGQKSVRGWSKVD